MRYKEPDNDVRTVEDFDTLLLVYAVRAGDIYGTESVAAQHFERTMRALVERFNAQQEGKMLLRILLYIFWLRSSYCGTV